MNTSASTHLGLTCARVEAVTNKLQERHAKVIFIDFVDLMKGVLCAHEKISVIIGV